MSEVRALIEKLVAAGVDPVDAAEIVTRAAIAGVAEASRSTGALRQERYRRNKASQTVTGDAELPFPKESPQTPKETPLSQPSTPKEKTPKGVQKKAVRLPADWQLPVDWRQDAIDQGLPPQRIDLEASKMRDWSLSSPNGAKRDWRASWRNWCRGAAEKINPHHHGPPGAFAAPSMADVFQMTGRMQDERPAEDFSSSRALVPHLSVANQRR